MEQERDRVICGRIKVYRSMVKAFSLDRDFFLRHPISVSWKGNVFEIKDGMHRALFQYMNGCRFLACSIPRAEYTRWLEETKSEVKKLQPGTAPVLHPYCYLWTAKTEDTYMTRMDAIFRFLAEEEISPKTALDLGENEGWTARNLCRAGIKTLCVVDAAEEGKLRTLDRVERTQVVTAHEIPGEELFDMALRLDLKKFTAATPECIQRLLRAAAYCVFFETADISSLNMIAGEYSVLKVSVNPEYPFEKLYLVAVKRSYTMN